jgi:hypothetical protein
MRQANTDEIARLVREAGREENRIRAAGVLVACDNANFKREEQRGPVEHHHMGSVEIRALREEMASEPVYLDYLRDRAIEEDRRRKAFGSNGKRRASLPVRGAPSSTESHRNGESSPLRTAGTSSEAESLDSKPKRRKDARPEAKDALDDDPAYLAEWSSQLGRAPLSLA